MNRISQLFNSGRGDLLSIYFCAGTPDPENTASVIRTLEENGVDMIEIGIPFSDPMADGPVIQDAATRALHNGFSLRKLFAQLEEIRTDVNIPLLLMGYLNPIMQYGFEAFCRDAARCGIDGCIIPDLPFRDYIKDYKTIADRYGIKVILLITPETEPERIKTIDEQTDGFIYMVSSASTTGAKDRFDDNALGYFERIGAMQLRNKRMIGFGISNRETFDTACRYAQGAIIGSRFVSLLEETKDAKKAITTLKEMIMRG